MISKKRGGKRADWRSISIASAIAVTIGSHPAFAQTETQIGSHISRAAPADIPDKLPDPTLVRATFEAFARCIVGSQRGSVERALSLSPIGKLYSQALTALSDQACLRGGSLEMDYPLLRGALFIALYNADYRRNNGNIAPQPLDFSEDVGGASTPEERRYIGLRQFADCVVRADPAASRALTLSRAGSSAENAAFSTLTAQLGPCINNGQTIGFSRIVLAGLIAETLYREAKASDKTAQ